MFASPRLDLHEAIPTINSAELDTVFQELDISLPEGDTLERAAEYVHHHWINDQRRLQIPGVNRLFVDTPEYPIFKAIGITDAVIPSQDHYKHGLLDGGTKPVFDYRLDYAEHLLKQGVSLNQLTLFGGQRLRISKDDATGKLEAIAKEIQPDLNSWGKEWVETELAKADSRHPWDRSFATEHEIAILSLLQHGRRSVEHVGHVKRPHPTSVAPSIPALDVHSELFDYDGQLVRVLNAPAVIRQFRGMHIPVEQSRPTGSSCYREWAEQLDANVNDTSTLLLTHNPSIYRTWLDILISQKAVGIKPGTIEAVGAAMQQHHDYGFVLGSFARLIIALDSAVNTYGVLQTEQETVPEAQVAAN